MDVPQQFKLSMYKRIAIRKNIKLALFPCPQQTIANYTNVDTNQKANVQIISHAYNYIYIYIYIYLVRFVDESPLHNRLTIKNQP